MSLPLPAWPADAVERVAIVDLLPYARNARTHSPSQVEKILRSMLEFGVTMPVLRDEGGTIIAGHGRILAAELGVSRGMPEFGTYPTMTARGWTEAQKRAYVIADNRLALDAGWDEELLRAEFGELKLLSFDLTLTGFETPEISEILAPPKPGRDPDQIPAAPDVPVSRPGDLWLLGPHALICGDCTDPATVERVLQGFRPGLMVTDPPYGVDYDPNWRNLAQRPDGSAYGASAVGKVENDGRADWREAWALFPGDVAYVWHSAKFGSVAEASLVAAGFETRAQIVWRKTSLIIGRGHYHFQHECAWYSVRRGKSANWQGSTKQSTVWDIDHRRSETGHGTQKPMDAMRRPIENNSAPGDRVYEPFSGSGTTIIAAQTTKRICHAVEINPVYVDVAVRRWEEFTGQAATLAETGTTFAAVAQARLGQVEPLV